MGRIRRSAAVLLIAVMLIAIAAGCSWFEFGGAKSAAQGVWMFDEEQLAAVHEGDGIGRSDVYYEIFVRAFADSDGNGIGDLRGIVNMLDYLNDGDPTTTGDLGVSGIWLMPIHPSPSYHGYDVTNYYEVHPEYGTMDDFRLLIDEAHKRGLDVIIDLVVNHSSSEHPWFLSAVMDEASDYRDWYVWREDPGSGSGTSATGGPAWHRSPGGGADYLGVFWSGMPDLNFANEQVRQEMIEIGKFWLTQGVDGFRLDAAKHIFEDMSGDENNPELQVRNLEWWAEFRRELEKVNPEVYLVGEVWDSSVARVAPYLQAFDSAFNFAAGELIVSAARREENSNVAFTLERALRAYEASSGGRFVDAPFLTNHDQNRVMSSLNGNVEHAAMAASILLTLPGRPFIYYGEEIGMQGVKPDEEIREPMKWVDEADMAAWAMNEAAKAAKHDPGELDAIIPDREAGTPDAETAGAEGGDMASGVSGIAAADYASAMTAWRVPRHQADTPSVRAQDDDPESLLNHYRALIHLRSKLAVLVDGAISHVGMDTAQAMAYERRSDLDRVLVVHNLGGMELQVEIAPDSHGEAYGRVIASSDSSVRLTAGDAGESAAVLTLPPYSTAILR